LALRTISFGLTTTLVPSRLADSSRSRTNVGSSLISGLIASHWSNAAIAFS
jgi:hypothetical protein